MVVLRCFVSVGISWGIKITILSIENAQNLIVIELLSNVVDRFFRLSSGAAFAGCFDPFNDLSLQSRLRPCHESGFGWGVMI